MKSELSKLHNYYVNEDPITKMMFDAFPDDFVLYGGAIVDWYIGNPHTIDYDACMLNDRWRDAEEFLLTQSKGRQIWEHKQVIVPGKNHFDTLDTVSGTPKKLSKGHLPWIVQLTPRGSFQQRWDGAKWQKPYFGISKASRKNAFELIDAIDSVPNRIAITKTDVVFRDERPIECIKWRAMEYDGWTNDPQHAYSRTIRYQRIKGFQISDKLWPAFDALLKYRAETQDVIKPEGYGEYKLGYYLRIDLETEDILNHVNKGLDIPRRYKIDYQYNDGGLIKGE